MIKKTISQTKRKNGKFLQLDKEYVLKTTVNILVNDKRPS